MAEQELSSMVLSNGWLFGYEGNWTRVKWPVWGNICETAASTCYWPLELKKITAGRAVSSSSLSSFVHRTKRHMFLFLPLSLLFSWLRERQSVALLFLSCWMLLFFWLNCLLSFWERGRDRRERHGGGRPKDTFSSL